MFRAIRIKYWKISGMYLFICWLFVSFLFIPTFAENDTGIGRALPRQENPVNEVIEVVELPVDRRNEAKNSNCSLNITATSKGGKILSPNYPNSYDGDLTCRWYLSSPKGQRIVLKFLDFNIETSPDCKYDNLKVHNNANSSSPPIGIYCGQMDDTTLRTNSSHVLIIFISDSTFEEKGFEIQYSLEAISKIEGCETELNETTGLITSPGFPNNYPENIDCWTLIRVPPDRNIFINFDKLSLEHDNACSYDYVDIFDGPRDDSPKLGRFCSEVQMANVISSKNTMLLHFHSDSVVSDKGFRAYYSTDGFIREGGKVGDCAWTYTDTNGTISSPNYPKKYPSNAKCIIHIKAPEQHHIKIQIEHLLLESDRNCSYDWLELRDGLGEGSTILGRFCGSKDKQILTSNSNKVSLIFNSDGFAEFSGFLAVYWFEENDFETFNRSEKEPVSPLVLNSADAFVSVSSNALVTQGASHILSCIPKNPVARVRWFLDENFIGGDFIPEGMSLSGNTSLKIESMNRNHVGMYTCAAVTAKDVAYAKIWISISYDKQNCSIVFRKTPKDVMVSEKGFTILECSTSTPGVRIYWEKNGETVETNEDIQMLHNGYLMLNNIQTKDEGVYICIANKTSEQCHASSSARVEIARRVNVTEICGRPKFGQVKEDKSQGEHGKIVGGKATVPGAYPWQVMLWEPQKKAFCGGSILNERWIITAAHCFAIRENLDWRKVILRLGKHDQTKMEGTEFSTKIEEIINHPSFEERTLDNDIALIRTVHYIMFTDRIQPICLGEQKMMEQTIFSRPYKMGIVTGWGQLVEGGSVSRFLREVRLPIVPQGTCRQSLVGTRYVASRNSYCAGYAQESVGDACRGDSGGPFQVEEQNIWYLVGLVSWGDGCAKKDKYGFYTKVNNYHSWIKGIIQT